MVKIMDELNDGIFIANKYRDNVFCLELHQVSSSIGIFLLTSAPPVSVYLRGLSPKNTTTMFRQRPKKKNRGNESKKGDASGYLPCKS